MDHFGRAHNEDNRVDANGGLLFQPCGTGVWQDFVIFGLHAINRKIWLLLFLCAVVTIGKAQEKVTPPQSMFFVANEGQWEEPVLFKLSGGGTTWFVTSTGMTMDIKEAVGTWHALSESKDGHGMPCPYEDSKPEIIRGHVLRMNFVNANPNPHYEGQDKLASYSNYFIGRDKCKWKSFVRHYQRVVAYEVWPGIDVEYSVTPPIPPAGGEESYFPPVYGGTKGGGVEILYHVKPRADISQIIIAYEGLDAPLRVDNEGNLILQTSLGEVKEKAPVAYQTEGKTLKQIPIHFKILSNNRYSLQCEVYDSEKELVIDPLLYSTYFGGGNGVFDFAHDPQNNFVLTGETDSELFPVSSGAYQVDFAGIEDCFVTELTADGRQIVYSTYIGGSDVDGAISCVVDNQGSVYSAGVTYSTDWPLTNDAFDTTFAGLCEGIFCKLSPDGSILEFSSYLGGAGMETILDLALDTLSREIYMTGPLWQLSTHDFPLSSNALFPTSLGNPSFFSVYSPASSSLVYSSLFPCEVDSSQIDASRIIPIGNGQIWISGMVWRGGLPVTSDALQSTYNGGDQDGFIALLDLHEDRLVYSTYFGGSGNDYLGAIFSLSADRVIVAGHTNSIDFPVTANAYDTSFDPGSLGYPDGFITILQRPDSIVSSTYIGGEHSDGIGGIYVNPDGTVIACGSTDSQEFPTTVDGFDTICGWHDSFICKLSSTLSHYEYGTYIGGSIEDDFRSGLLDGQDSIWIGGITNSPDYPVTSDAYQPYLPGWTANFISHLYIGQGSNISQPQKPVPSSFSLEVYPNPFNPSTTISFTLPHAGAVKLSVYDVLGRNVGKQPFASTKNYSAGEHHVTFDGAELASGIYFVRMEAGKDVMTRKMMLLR